jgi:hypothetical protein
MVSGAMRILAAGRPGSAIGVEHVPELQAGEGRAVRDEVVPAPGPAKILD